MNQTWNRNGNAFSAFFTGYIILGRLAINNTTQVFPSGTMTVEVAFSGTAELKPANFGSSYINGSINLPMNPEGSLITILFTPAVSGDDIKPNDRITFFENFIRANQ